MKKHVLAAALFAVAATPAAAYTSYLKPESYWPEGREVAVEGSFASTFFAPQIALPADIAGRNPDGSEAVYDRVAVQETATRLEANLPAAGTYRISTGEQLGNVTTLVGENGQWRALAQGETPAEGAPVTTLQTVTLADTYVTRGQASRQVVDQPHGRLAIKPVTHPNQVLAAQGFQVDILFDGAPLANSAVVLYGEGDPDTDLDRYVVTDAAGRATFTFDAPGHYVIAARHRADMPAGSAAQVGSYTTTLTFEALTEVPAGYDVAEREAEAERAARRRERTPARRRVGRPDY
ncbi:MAG TPA: DUF4198 domain-containing protein [Vitreimonas sp.]|uniref:DUF4198 domain-containing protein n=1 Tax=Vitreimonas sp. TaxID=3069702 RepID=UPI002D44804C|nr:DUF4198 domain-containing protein [Vitreimonas sp.]HYD87682.1 DUF4198 domain-containing protein [Vitreimonas sp.]